MSIYGWNVYHLLCVWESCIRLEPSLERLRGQLMSAMNLIRHLPVPHVLAQIQDHVGSRCVSCDERSGVFANDFGQGGWTTTCVVCFETFNESTYRFARLHHGYSRDDCYRATSMLHPHTGMDDDDSMTTQASSAARTDP